MFIVYAVIVHLNGARQRQVLQSFDSLDEARWLANRATCGPARYAYAVDSRDGTVIYLGAVDPYGPGNLPVERQRQLLPLPED